MNYLTHSLFLLIFFFISSLLIRIDRRSVSAMFLLFWSLKHLIVFSRNTKKRIDSYDGIRAYDKARWTINKHMENTQDEDVWWTTTKFTRSNKANVRVSATVSIEYSDKSRSVPILLFLDHGGSVLSMQHKLVTFTLLCYYFLSAVVLQLFSSSVAHRTRRTETLPKIKVNQLGQ